MQKNIFIIRFSTNLKESQYFFCTDVCAFLIYYFYLILQIKCNFITSTCNPTFIHQKSMAIISNFFLCIYTSLMYYILVTVPPTFLLVPFHLPFSQDPLFFHLPSENSSLSGLSTKHGIISYNKISHITLYKAYTSNTIGGNRVSKTGKISQPIFALLGLPQEHQVTHSHNICRESRSDLYRLLDCQFSLCEALWVLLGCFCDSFSCGVLDPSDNPSLSSSVEFLKHYLMFGCGSLVSPSTPTSCWMQPL